MPVAWFEIGTHCAQELEKFYRDVFLWKFRTDASFDGHSIVETGEGGLRGAMWSIADDILPYACPYIRVQDLESTVQKAVAAGGRELLAPRPGPGTLRFAHIADPEGNRIGLFQI